MGPHFPAGRCQLTQSLQIFFKNKICSYFSLVYHGQIVNVAEGFNETDEKEVFPGPFFLIFI